jgi:uncharacterized membrane protein
MKNLADFFKTTALGGFFVLLPVLLLYLMMAEALELVTALAGPIADLFPKGTFDKISHPVAMGTLLILGTSFLIGLGLRSEKGRRLGQWIEKTVLGRVPAYGAIKSLTTGFTEADKDGAIKTALLTAPTGEREIAYIIEDHGNGQLTVLTPRAPTAFSGPVKIVSRDRIEVLDANLGDVSLVMNQWGVGVRDLLGKHTADAESSVDYRVDTFEKE